ncbi:hypothetical protein TSA6c_00420 [Azospirillum sp. TSA6c]|uniref:hypothetical protein n=1 Tax=Azospirillum sp. TSA6c TaxID=709813 RepID=UPI000D622985|nr:hypothetical protein [Azospirillum sp. TSA6c]PWC54366.1 hypothetical protein TSA6c_00420 [Azospirillum sp. TSA6c]
MVLSYDEAKRTTDLARIAELTKAIDASILEAMRRNETTIVHHLPEVTADSPENELPGDIGEAIRQLYADAGWEVEIHYPQICLSGRVILQAK